MPEPACQAGLVRRPEYEAYDFGPEHPLRPDRIRTSFSLLEYLRMAPPSLQLPTATLDELRLVHTEAYLDAVQRLDAFADECMVLGYEAARWGLGAGDSPAFPGMHAATACVVGGSLNATRGVLRGELQHAFNPAGGLHHAMPERASGFCIYNDVAVAIAAAVHEHHARVLYLDFDAHHGDGVQATFYAEPRVLTFSMHETGRHLFPGSGFSQERGVGAGHGYSLNLPVEPFTEDGSWIDALDVLLPAMANAFVPDLVVSQHGCDSHAWDPLTHLRLSTRAFAAQARLVHQLAHAVAHGRWVATGGGGYDWARVVPRSWAIVWAEMSGQQLPLELPPEWIATWTDAAQQEGFAPMPRLMHDTPETWEPIPRRTEIERTNRERAETVHRLVSALQNRPVDV
jgi:acetoin utilization protein AcuC